MVVVIAAVQTVFGGDLHVRARGVIIFRHHLGSRKSISAGVAVHSDLVARRSVGWAYQTIVNGWIENKEFRDVGVYGDWRLGSSGIWITKNAPARFGRTHKYDIRDALALAKSLVIAENEYLISPNWAAG